MANHTLDGTPYILVNTNSFANDDVAEPLQTDLRYAVTHELGHVLGLMDWFCNPSNNPATDAHEEDKLPPGTHTLMNTRYGFADCDSPNGKPTHKDVHVDYCETYSPHGVVPTTSEGTGRGGVRLRWDSSEVHVQSGFEVRRWDSTTNSWLFVKTVGADKDLAVLSGQPAGMQFYVVLSVTNALPHPTTQEYAYGESSRVIQVEVPGTLPRVPIVPTDPPDPPTFNSCESLPAPPMCQVSASVYPADSGHSVVTDNGTVICGETVTISAWASTGWCFKSRTPAPLPGGSSGTARQTSDLCQTSYSAIIETSGSTPVQAFILTFEAAPQPMATLALSSTSISENGGSTTVTATLSSAAPAGGASLTVSASGGSGYSLSTNRALTFSAGAMSSRRHGNHHRQARC